MTTELVRVLRAGSHSFSWGRDHAPYLMAIVNATPDSFSDGGLHFSAEDAIHFGSVCASSGAAIVDVGGESTRPGADRISIAEQIHRTRPVVAALAQLCPVSIDTTRAEVARTAISAGACMVNDVSAGTDDPDIIDAACAGGAAMVLMHRLFAPNEDRISTAVDARRQYQDVVKDVRDWLAARVEVVTRAGLPRDRIAIDPGLGFGKSVEQNAELLNSLDQFARLDLPILVGASRKSFLGALVNQPDPKERDPASIAAALHATTRGAAILRVHEIPMHKQALALQAALTKLTDTQRS